MTKFLLEFTNAETGRTVALNVHHLVDVSCEEDGTASITTAEHIEGLLLTESYEHVRDRIDDALDHLYHNGGTP